MRRQFNYAMLALAFIGQFAAGCASARVSAKAKKPADQTAATAPPEAAPLSPEALDLRVEALTHYSLGVAYELRDEPERALASFTKSALADPGNEPLVLDVARRLIRRKEPEAAVKALELLGKAAAYPGSSGAVDALLGVAHAQAGRTEEAIAASRAAIVKAPRLMQGYQNLVQLYLQANRAEEALKLLDQATKTPAPSAQFLIDLSDLYATYIKLRIHELDAVKPKLLAVLSEAAKLQPAAPGLVQRMAENYRLVGEFKQAADLYLALLKRFPEQPSFRDRLIDLYLRGNDRKAAAEQLESVIRDNPTNPQANYFLGAIAHEEKNLDKAAEAFEKAIRFGPDLEPAYYELAGVRLSQDQAPQAVAVLEKARALFKVNFVLEFYSGLAQSRLKNYAKAAAHFTSAELLAKRDEPERLTHVFYFQVGATQERNKNFAEAEKYFEQCLRLSPDFADALNFLGYMWAERGMNLSRAREMIEKAVKQEPDNAAFLDSLGWVFFKLGQPKEALPWLLKSIQHTKEPDATLHDHLGDVYLALKQIKEAREEWRKSLAIEPNAEIQKKLDAALAPR